ncbi:MAG TPA: PASTA domain-containing protein [Acidobacteriaceae bacterium]|nr:PASTA domain-containing protein [Acidobacteriaceae bacterium]
MIAFFRFVLVVLLLVIVAMTSAIVTMHFAIHGAEVATPDFRGMTLADAGQRAAAAGLSLHVENKLYSTDVPEGRVANQSPLAGAIVRRGWRVWLTESLGPQKLAIPDTLGKDQRVASIEIRRADLQTGSVASFPMATAEAGTVVAQSPAPGASGVASPVVNLLVAAPPSAAPTSPAYVMPDVTGQLFTAAALLLTRAGLQMAPLKTVNTHIPAVGAPATAGAPAQPTPPPAPAAPSGTVVAQSPAPGSRVDATTPIQLTVAQ